jgi:metal-dependent hydrolase (beta-lactamase superfamily II)
MANHLRATSTGEWEPDPLVTDERFMVAHVSGKGLVIFTGCSHAGIVNICRHAQELFPETPFYALVGGLPLVYPNEDLIERDHCRDQGVRLQTDHSRTLHGLAGNTLLRQRIRR